MAAYSHSDTSSAGSVASRPHTPARALIAAAKADRSSRLTTAQTTRAWWPGGISASRAAGAQTSWSRSGRRSRRSDGTGAGVGVPAAAAAAAAVSAAVSLVGIAAL